MDGLEPATFEECDYTDFLRFMRFGAQNEVLQLSERTNLISSITLTVCAPTATFPWSSRWNTGTTSASGNL